MNSYHREATVGLLVLTAVGLFIAGTLWLRGRSIGRTDLTEIVFSDISNLKTGAPVRISGAPVGKVETIVFEAVGRVKVGVSFSAPIEPTTGARATIATVGMLGDNVIDFDPGQGAPLPDDTPIVGTLAQGIFDKGAGLADQASQTLSSVNRMLDTALVTDLRRTLATTERLMALLADRNSGPTAEVNATMRSLQRLSARLDTSLAGVNGAAMQARVDTTMRSAAQLADRLGGMTARMDSLLGRIERGEGTLGKLASDTTLYVELRRTLGAASALVDTLAKHPGKLGITVRVF